MYLQCICCEQVIFVLLITPLTIHNKFFLTPDYRAIKWLKTRNSKFSGHVNSFKIIIPIPSTLRMNQESDPCLYYSTVCLKSRKMCCKLYRWDFNINSYSLHIRLKQTTSIQQRTTKNIQDWYNLYLPTNRDEVKKRWWIAHQ